MSNLMKPDAKRMLLTCALAGALASPALTAAVAPSAAVTAAASVAPAAVPLRYNSVTSNRQASQLRRLWGIDNIHVRSTASGALVRFSYRVVDPDKARILNFKEATPYLVDEQHGLALQIPVME